MSILNLMKPSFEEEALQVARTEQGGLKTALYS